MRLYTRTPAGHAIGISVQLTGQIKESAGKLIAVEIRLPNGCEVIAGYDSYATKLPTTPYLWAAPDDICADDGPLGGAALRAEIKRVNEQRRVDMLRGPLGETWP